MRLYLMLFYLFMSTGSLYAQFKPAYSQFLLNPFLYNPAFAGREGRYEVHLNHRRQWIGIHDAPVLSTLSFHTGFGNGMAVGFNVYNFSRGVITTNSAQLVVGYKARMGPQHSLHFGLGGGFSGTGLDYSRIDNPNDPAVLSGFYHTLVSEARFGINYHLMGLNLGFTLPDLLYKNPLYANAEQNSKLYPFHSYIVNADYQFDLQAGRLVLQPYLLYQAGPSVTSQWEGGGLVYLYHKVHVGGAYKQYQGPTALMGVSLDKNITLGYAYEFANQVVNSLGQGSHEIQISVRFGKVKSGPKPAEKASATQEIKEQDKQEVMQPENDIKTTEPTGQPEVHQEETVRSSFKKGHHPDELPSGYYVVVGVYSNKANAHRAIRQLAEKGYQASAGINSQSKYYYVYVSHTGDITECRKIRDQYRAMKWFKDAWMLEIKE